MLNSKSSDIDNPHPGSARSLAASFRFAFNGFVEVLRTQRNARIHGIFTILVILAGIFFQIERLEWAAIALAIALVWVTEMFNSALEKISDRVDPEFHPLIKAAKDIAAAAVLLSAIAAVLIGLLIFGPLVWDRFLR